MLVLNRTVQFGQTLLDRLVAAGLLPPDHAMQIPDLPEDFVPESLALMPPSTENPLLHLPPFLAVPVPCLLQVNPRRSRETLWRWLPGARHEGPYWVVVTVMLLGRFHMPPDEEVKRFHLSYGEAACLVAQFPEFGCCRTRQPGCPVLQARYSRRRKCIVLNGESHGGNDMFHFTTFLRNGARLNPPGAVMSVRVQA